jgi:carbonic anhydrase/acetyltransferase-like protein (isoleucine patch superfamily)
MSLRRLVKRAVFAMSVIVASPVIALCMLEKVAWRGERLFLLGTHVFALVPGFPGTYLRAGFYWATLDACSWESHIGFGSLFTHRSASVGSRVSTGVYCVIGHARIGDGTMLGSRVSIPSGKRQHFDDDGALSAGTRYDTVSIGRGCWIGEGAIVMADVGDGTVVSAGAVVTQRVPERCLAGGNPAKVLRGLSGAH